MPNTFQEAELYAVVQFGGSSGEQYFYTFTTKSQALDYIRVAYSASYRCLGPFPIALGGVRKLAEAAKESVGWLTSNGFEDAPIVETLAKAVTNFEREWSAN